MDELIVAILYVYGVLLCAAVINPPHKRLLAALATILPIRLVCVGMRISLGSDIEAYSTVLKQCDLSAINALELF